MEIDFKCQYKTDYVAGGADVTILPDVVDDSLTANGKWIYSLETVNPTKELIYFEILIGLSKRKPEENIRVSH